MLRRSIVIDGIVQGVGFRPFVYGLALQLKLAGFVRNNAGRVEIEIEGARHAVDQFLARLSTQAPPLANIENISWQSKTPRGERRFRIRASEKQHDSCKSPIFISPDIATCDECLRDLFDPHNRRHLYPFVNCTNCGPRLTIVKSAPYDRRRTTMASFEMCPHCRREYEDPTDRRFHAQPICCPQCGPRLELRDRKGNLVQTVDPIKDLAQAIEVGKVAAIKGLGGYHLSCNARNELAVQQLRSRKHREEKSFAIMVKDLALARLLCQINDDEAALLYSSRRPIVLLQKRTGNPGGIAESVAPNNPRLGIMLPYTPVHHLLLRAVNGMPLVMTSGNCSDEPIAYEDSDALARLNNITDLFLAHDRPIHVRCDDSVTRVVDGAELPIRRSRGYAPQSVHLPIANSTPTLAVGGQLKSTFALAREDNTFISHHLGDLDHFQASRAFEHDVQLYENLFEIHPRLIVHDLHPDYASTQYAYQRAQQGGLALLPIQHHHAHMASCMAENGLNERMIGVTFDGTGYGTDGTIWGGEFLVGDYGGFTRAAHLRYVPMPGTDAAIHEPWRMAVAYLDDAECQDSQLFDRADANSLRVVRQMIAKSFNAPMTSSAGRLFDAVASLIGIRDRVSYEGQAAVEMEQLATGFAVDGSYAFELSKHSTGVIDTRPLIRAVAAEVKMGVSRAIIARRFHSTIVEFIAATCQQIAKSTDIHCVVLSGGVFMNALLTSETMIRLNIDGFRVFRHKVVPPNDGGLSLGQLAIAAAMGGHAKRAEPTEQQSNLEPICASPSPAK